MLVRHHHHVLPLKAGHGDQTINLGNRFRGDRQICLTIHHHLSDLPGIALQQGQPHLGKFLRKRLHHRRQGITRLRMRSRYRKTARVLSGKFLAYAFQAFDLLQYQFYRFQHLPARFGQPAYTLAVAGEDIDTQLLFQLDNGFRHAWLRSKQSLGGLSQIEILAHSLTHETKLMDVHDLPRSDRNDFKKTIICLALTLSP